MNFVRLLPVILSCLVLGAHFSRAELLPLVIFCAMFPFILLVKARWVPLIMQVFLVLGTLEWVRTILVLVKERLSQGQDWLRMALILGGVALFTLLSVLVFRNKKIAERFMSAKA